MADGKQRPGVMIYFDAVRPALNRLNNDQCGALFRAILDYSELGEMTDLEPMTGMVFDLLRPKLDRDAERYEEGREQRQYATYCREAKKKDEQPQTFDRWKAFNALRNAGSASPSPFNPPASPVPAANAVVGVDADGVTDGAGVKVVDGYYPTPGNIGSISSDNYEQDFEKKRQEAQEKLLKSIQERANSPF